MAMASNGRANLVVQGGPNSGMAIELAGRPVTLGRRSDNDIVVDESTVSRRHALILETPQGYVIRDLSTPNGTYVNSERVGDSEVPLNHGDRIRLAGSSIMFVFRQEGPSTVPMKAPHHTGVIQAVAPSASTGTRTLPLRPNVTEESLHSSATIPAFTASSSPGKGAS